MNDYVIVSDATLDLPEHVVKEYGIRIIPMGFYIDDTEYSHYPDERELAIEDFYDKLKKGSVSSTTQITPILFMDYFEEILKQDLDIIYIAFSSGLSGTYHSSQMVMKELREEYPDRKIVSVDSLGASIGEGLLVLNAALQKKNGMDIEQLATWVEENKQHARHWFTVQDLFYLKRGGRISSIEAMIGTALKIRPVLSMDEVGKLIIDSKVRGSRAELDLLLTKLTNEGTDLSNQIIIIGHADNLEKAKELESIIRSSTQVKDIVISKIGPVIGTHTGPGMLALAFMGDKK